MRLRCAYPIAIAVFVSNGAGGQLKFWWEAERKGAGIEKVLTQTRRMFFLNGNTIGERELDATRV